MLTFLSFLLRYHDPLHVLRACPHIARAPHRILAIPAAAPKLPLTAPRTPLTRLWRVPPWRKRAPVRLPDILLILLLKHLLLFPLLPQVVPLCDADTDERAHGVVEGHRLRLVDEFLAGGAQILGQVALDLVRFASTGLDRIVPLFPWHAVS